ncbi:hypothetical protein PQE66_gp036 [Bacillus phage PBC2]|uniref:Uncharacterized protein n=1 Tax=Bacillus phage PBC2 TaxID=1675029 RepID=A0A218KBT7_9CAUD|nr:hypothetical protein PQE66_gp036 [Bacillus phage PBC2]AKQ08351.1 hypothetical protein PBC2_036 [Bacillus phage PBC2]
MNNLDKLPDMCFGIKPSTGEVCVIMKGIDGYFISKDKIDYSNYNVDLMNEDIGVTKRQRIAMEIGATFGWHVPAVDIDMYDEDGRMIP